MRLKDVHTIDYEYNRKDNEFLHLVCVSIDDEVYWLNDHSDTVKALSRLKQLEGGMLIAHSASLAEIPCSAKLGANIDNYIWFDTETTFKFINHIKQGTQGNAIKTSLIECLKNYGLAENFTTTEAKNQWRDIILNGDVEANKEGIIKYCSSDTNELKELARREIEELIKLTAGVLFGSEFEWEKYKAYIDDLSIPYNAKNTKKFNIEDFLKFESLNHISVAKMYMESYDADPYLISHLRDWRYMDELKKQCNELIPNLFDENGIRKDEVLKDWIFSNIDGAKEWWDKGHHKNGEIKTKTSTGGYSFSGDVVDYFCKEFECNEKLEKYRVLRKLIQAVQGLAKEPEDPKGWYYPNLFKDGLHCHANEHGANTTRFGNKSSAGHIPSWSKSLRSCLKPNNENEVYFSLDFNAQEMWIVGQMSKDYNLLDTYEAKDVYMAMAQQMGKYPKTLPIPTEEERNEEWFKPYKQTRKEIKGVNLGMNYGMSYETYARRNNIPKEQAKSYWDLFARTFYCKTQWGQVLQAYFARKLYNTDTRKCAGFEGVYKIIIGKEQIVTTFRNTTYSNNYNKQQRAILNFPIQCMGAQITRRAIRYCQEKGLHPFLPVHDEIYFKTSKDKLNSDIEIARDCMIRAAFDCMENPLKGYPIKVGNAECHFSDKYVIHEGAEERFNQIMEICKKLDELGVMPPKPQKKKNKLKENIEDKLDLEGFYA